MNVIRIDVERERALGAEARLAFRAWMRENQIPEDRTRAVSIDGSEREIVLDVYKLNGDGQMYRAPGTNDAAMESVTLPLRTELPDVVVKAVS